MKLTLRSKLVLLATITFVALVIVSISSGIASEQVGDGIAAIREHYVPRVGLRVQLTSEFDGMRHVFQDAVAAQDGEALADAAEARERMLRVIRGARGALDPARVRSLVAAIDDYYGTALGVAQSLLAGETGEALLEAMSSLQAKQTRVTAAIDATTMLRRDEMSAAFRGVVRTQEVAARVLAVTAITSLLLAAAFTAWVSRSLLKSVASITEGIERFGRGEFDREIPASGGDELSDIAKSANGMARSLAELGEERARAAWRGGAHAGLSRELRGELRLVEVGERSLRFLARYLDAPIGAVHFAEASGELRTLATYAGSEAAPAARGESQRPQARFAPGEGLVGQALLSDEATEVSDLPADYMRIRSGLGESAPRALLLVPLIAAGARMGVLELGGFTAFGPEAKALLMSIRETLAIAMQVAEAREATRRLLAETQSLAVRLQSQEDELRAANDELQGQQEELRQTNEELTHQTHELDSQRRIVEKKNAELEETRASLERQATELASVSAYKSQFLANMSHELRTPLNSMLLLSSLLSENQGGNLSQKQVDQCKTINAAGIDLLALINQVLDLAKIESGKQELHLETVELRSIVEPLRAVFEPLADQKKLALELRVDSNVPTSLTTDPQRIGQVLTNLLGNAIKFTARGRVTLHVFVPAAETALTRRDLRAEDAIAFAVTDTGPGISLEHRERIFEPFEQADHSTERRFGGTGLGLAIAREIGALLGGELGLESTPGVGSTFTLFVPRRPDGAGTKEAPARPAPAPVALEPDASERAKLRDPTVLLIEDDAEFSSWLRELIEAQGLHCLLARTGQEGIEIARAKLPSGIILDLGLPDIEGWEVRKKLSEDPRTASIPVHVVTARSADERARSMGVVGYLTKPASKDEVVRSLDALVPPRLRKSVVRVLVVEDDREAADSLVAQLAREDMQADRVGSAAEATRALEEHRYQCMVLDLSLPDMDGLELLRNLANTASTHLPSVIVYTGRALTKAETRSIEEFAQSIVLKDGPSTERLVHEVKLFARKVTEGSRGNTAALRAGAVTDTSLSGRCLLLVDDDMRTVYALSALLRSRGADVLVADTGAAALSTLADRPNVDAVLMDIMMPEMDGYEAMRRIRKDPRLAKLPILALTAKAMVSDEAKCLEAGATAYLSKPIDPPRLFRVLSDLLRKEA